MKQQLKQKIIIGCLLSMSIIADAQFNLGIAPALRTTGGGSQNTAVGIGNFPTTPSVESRLHVNNFLLGAPTGPLNGFLFRTDGDQSTVNQWQLFTGSNATTTTEKFRLFVPANSSDVNFNAVQTGNMNFFTNGVQRMTILGSASGPSAGFVGIGMGAPIFPLEVYGNLPANSQLWNRGIMIENRASLYWNGGPATNRHYFMAHSSVSPAGNFYQGYSIGLGPAAPVDYVSTVYVTTNPSAGPDGSSTFFKWLFVAEAGFERRFGVNTINPTRTVEIKNVNTNNWQLRLTNQNNSFTDFQTLGTGNLSIQPQNGRTGFNLLLINPTHTIDVNGNARIRDVQTVPAPQSIIIGQQVGGVNDRELKRLDFTGNPNQVLLGNGTWGTAPVSNTGVGNYCGATLNPLINNYEIPLNDKNYYFSGQASNSTGNKSSVAIGIPCSVSIPFSKLYVQQSVANTTYNPPLSVSGHFANTAMAGFAVGVAGQALLSATNNFGVYTNAQGASNANYGVYAVAPATGSNRAGYFLGQLETTASVVITSDQMFKTDVSGIKNAMEVIRKLKPHTYKMKIDDYPQFNFDDKIQYGFVAQELEQIIPDIVKESYHPGLHDSLGVNSFAPVSYKSINYNALIPITIQAINDFVNQQDKLTLSDQNIKTNVENLNGSLSKVCQMRGVKYNWTSAAQQNIDMDSLEHIGFIAQEISAIEPLLTFVDDSSLMHINYDRMVPLLVESIKELNNQMQEKDSIIHFLEQNDIILNDRLTALENCINALNLCGTPQAVNQNNNNSSTAITTIDLKDIQSIVLEQNVPNPFAEQTTINYFLPETVTKAQMLFYNAQGKLIQSVELSQKGKGSINVFAQDLSTGIYTYTLVADGQIVETKKMIKN